MSHSSEPGYSNLIHRPETAEKHVRVWCLWWSNAALQYAKLALGRNHVPSSAAAQPASTRETASPMKQMIAATRGGLSMMPHAFLFMSRPALPRVARICGHLS